MSYLPEPFKKFRDAHAAVWERYESLAATCHSEGPLAGRDRELVKFGIAVGLSSEGAVKSHARKALEADVTAEELEHATLLALTTAGFPAMVAAREWLTEVVEAD